MGTLERLGRNPLKPQGIRRSRILPKGSSRVYWEISAVHYLLGGHSNENKKRLWYGGDITDV